MHLSTLKSMCRKFNFSEPTYLDSYEASNHPDLRKYFSDHPDSFRKNLQFIEFYSEYSDKYFVACKQDLTAEEVQAFFDEQVPAPHTLHHDGLLISHDKESGMKEYEFDNTKWRVSGEGFVREI